MLTLPPSVRVYIATEPCDMRKQFDGLAVLVQHVLRQDARGGHLFVFFNRRSVMVRTLFWDRSGWCPVSKRLERGSFRMPWNTAPTSTHVEVEAAELALILEGIDLRNATRRKRWTPLADELSDRSATVVCR